MRSTTQSTAGAALGVALIVVFGALASACQEARGRSEVTQIAVTLDDLPWLGAPGPGEDRVDATRRLLGHLDERGVPAVGFVNCERMTPDARILRMWLDKGMGLGNHSESHRDLNDAPLDTWIADVRSCDRKLRDVTGEPVLFFRFPFLHQGPTRERKRAALDILDQLDYRIAHVTVDNSEWVLRRPYERALQSGNDEEQRKIGALLVNHVVAAAEHARAVARRKFGRDVDHVLLLHANVLVADQLGVLLDSLSARGFSFISLEEALSDPVYRRPDRYTGPNGLSWLYRAEPATPEDVAWDEAREAALRRAVGG